MKIGFDVGGTNLRMHVFDAQWDSVAERSARIRGDLSPESVASQIAQMVAEFGSPEVVGIGLAGQMSKDGKIVYNSPNLGWRDVAFTEVLRAHEELATTRLGVANDLNAVLFGEWCEGAAQGASDVLAVYVGTGVGGAFLIDGELVHGAGGKAGEIGHVKVSAGGRLCGCGEFGCVEAYAGGVHLERQVFAALNDSLPGFEDPNQIDLKAADDLYKTNAAITEIWEQATDFLGMSVANATTLLNPALLLMGGGIMENLPNFSDLTLRKITPYVLSAARDDLRIKLGILGDRAGALGACRLADRDDSSGDIF